MPVPTTADWVREPAVAGLFYPADRGELHDAVSGHMDGPVPDDAGEPRALIAPHAGYRYSGPTAGTAYRTIAARRGGFERVVLAGPAHRVAVDGVGLGVSSARAWRTPLGDVPVDHEACEHLVAEGAAVVADDAHAPEHSLEVHLPFLLEVLGAVPIVPLLVGRCTPGSVAAALDLTWDGATLVVVSSDLSHYLTDQEARARDERTRCAVLEGRVADIGPYDACGHVAVGGLMVAATRHDVAPRSLALATSAASSGDRSRVVGYGSFVFAPPRALRPDEGAWLAARARAAVRHEVATGTVDPVADVEVPDRLRLPGASFVTLRLAGALAGCIGTLTASRPLWRDVAVNARGAAFADPRFAPLTTVDLDATEITVAVLSPLEPLPTDREALLTALRPGSDGVLIESDGHRGTFLPSVWDTLATPEAFLQGLLAKAHIGAEPWPTDARVWRYTVEEFTG